MAVTDAEKQAALADPTIVSRYYEDRLAALGSPEAAMQAVIDAQQEYELPDTFVSTNLPQNVQSLYTQQVQAEAAAAESGLPYLDLTPAATPAVTSQQTPPVDTGVQAPQVTEGIIDWDPNRSIQVPLPEGFNWQSYVSQNPDLLEANIDTPEEAALHYQTWGFAEPRSGVTDPLPAITPVEVPIPDVDLATALRMNPDLGAAGIDTQQEFEDWYRASGVNENRRYTGFSDEEIIKFQKDLIASGMPIEQVQQEVARVGGMYGVDPTRVENLLNYDITTMPTYTGGTTGTDVTTGTTGTTGITGTGGTTGTTGTTGTGGLIGSQPTAAMLTPFQKSVMAQNQALLGTYGSTAPNLNPYTQMVANQALSELNRQRQMTQQDIGYQATQAGAFGGSRHGVAEALTNEAFARQGANMLAPLMYQGYQAGVQNELNRAAQMANLGQQSFNYGTSINQMLAGAGTQQQALNQAQIDTAAQQAGAYQTYPAVGAGTFSQILGAAPSGQTSTYNPGVMDYLTLAATAYGASDIRLKKNIKKVGELSNGLGVYTWEWKEKVKDLVGNFSMTKGVMAQEAMKVIPEAVIAAPNGYLAVDYSHPELSGVA